MDVLCGGRQGVETVLESHDLEGHVAGGQDEDADSAKRVSEHPTQQWKWSLPIELHLLRFHLTKSDSQDQIEEEDGV